MIPNDGKKRERRRECISQITARIAFCPHGKNDLGMNSGKAEVIKFLKNPFEIRKAVMELQGGISLNLAVAFVGADWSELFANHGGKLRLMCWLENTNTNPYAVEDLMNRPETEVRQRNSMHAKVYLAPKVGAVVGSSNLSKTAYHNLRTLARTRRQFS